MLLHKPEKLLRKLPQPNIKGAPGSEEHKKSSLAYANTMYDYSLNGPFSFDSPSPEKAYRATGIRNSIIRELGYKPVVRPGGTQLKWMGVPERHHPVLRHLDKDFKAGQRLKHQIEKESDFRETNLRAEAFHYKLMGDTLSQANTNKKATELRKHYDDQIEKVYRRPSHFGKMVRENETAAKKKQKPPHELYEPFAQFNKLYKGPKGKVNVKSK